MPQRKAWTPQQDKTLKHLKEELLINRWSVIAKKMAEDYDMPGRTGKQCRERYHNHLDSRISRAEWTREQQQNLYALHDEIGNKWAIIAQRLPGRTDNCVKNHFYSRMRKAIRKLNKTIHHHFRKDYKQIKMPVLYKIVQATDQRFKNNSNIQAEISEHCCKIKNMLLLYSNDDNNTLENDLQKLRQLSSSIHDFSINYKRNQKMTRINSQDGNDLLKLPKFQIIGNRTLDHRSEQMQQMQQVQNCMNPSQQSDQGSQDDEKQQLSALKSTKIKSIIQLNKKVLKLKIKEQNIKKQINFIKPPVISIPIPTLLPKISLNFDDDNEKLADMLRNQGVLEQSINDRRMGIRRDDSINIILDESGRNNILGESVNGIKNLGQNLSNLNLSVELDEQQKLFISN